MSLLPICIPMYLSWVSMEGCSVWNGPTGHVVPVDIVLWVSAKTNFGDYCFEIAMIADIYWIISMCIHFCKTISNPTKWGGSAGTCTIWVIFHLTPSKLLFYYNPPNFNGQEKNRNTYMVFLFPNIRCDLLLSNAAGTMVFTGLEKPNYFLLNHISNYFTI